MHQSSNKAEPPSALPGGRSLSRRAFLGATGAAGVAAGSALLGLDAATAGAQDRRRSLPARLSVASKALTTPQITVTIPPSAATAPGNILITPFSLEYDSGPMIVDSAGAIVWFQSSPDFTTNLQMQTYQSQPVLTWWQGDLVLPEGYGRGTGIILDTDYNQVATVEAASGQMADLHEFVITPQDTALITVYEERPQDLSAVGGPSDGRILDSGLQEIDIATGSLVRYWWASHHVELSDSHIAPPTSASDPYDFFHLNSIDVDADGNLLISSRNTWCLYKVERKTGRIMWRLGGKQSDFVLGPGTRFQLQHHARHHPGGIVTVFDDGARPDNKRSRGLKLAVNQDKFKVDLIEAYVHQPTFFAGNQGSTQLLPNGNVLVGWGSVPVFTEYSSDGRPLYEAQLPTSVTTYRALRAEWPVAS